MICYLESKNDTVLKICSAEKFTELTEDQRTAVLIDAYRSGQNPGAKQMLPSDVNGVIRATPIPLNTFFAIKLDSCNSWPQSYNFLPYSQIVAELKA